MVHYMVHYMVHHMVHYMVRCMVHYMVHSIGLSASASDALRGVSSASTLGSVRVGRAKVRPKRRVHLYQRMHRCSPRNAVRTTRHSPLARTAPGSHERAAQRVLHLLALLPSARATFRRHRVHVRYLGPPPQLPRVAAPIT